MSCSSVALAMLHCEARQRGNALREATYLGIIHISISLNVSLCPIFAKPEKYSLAPAPSSARHTRKVNLSKSIHNTKPSCSQSSSSSQIQSTLPMPPSSHEPLWPPPTSLLCSYSALLSPSHFLAFPSSTLSINTLYNPPSQPHSMPPAQP